MENDMTIETVPETAKKKASKFKPWQKITAAVLAVALVAGLGVAVALELTKNKNSSAETTEGITEEQETQDEDAFANAAHYDLVLKDGENLISTPGVYTVTGSTTNGYIHVNSGDEDKVKLILTNVTIKNPSGAAIWVESNGNVHIETVGTNTLDANPGESEDAAIYSKADLIFKGDGKLVITSTADGIKGKDDVKIKSGTFDITASEDGIKGKDSLTIKGGDITVAAGDDAIKSSNEEDETKGVLKIEGGTIKVTKSYEALEAQVIIITGGDIDVVASDDGINAASDLCNSNAMSPTGNADITFCKIDISGGTVHVNAGGDGLDANGSVYLSGGTVFIDGPTSSGDGALDYDGVMEITGGTIVAVGMSGMAENATSATQGSALVNLSTTYSAGSVITIGDVTFTTAKSFNSVMVSSPSLQKGESYDLKINGATVQTVQFTDYLVGSGSGMGGGMMGGGQGGAPSDQGGQAPSGQSGQAPSDMGGGQRQMRR